MLPACLPSPLVPTQAATALFVCSTEEGCETAVVEAGRAISGGRGCLLVLDCASLASPQQLQVGRAAGQGRIVWGRVLAHCMVAAFQALPPALWLNCTAATPAAPLSAG